MRKEAQIQIRNFYKKFKQAHDNSGYALVAVAAFYFLNTISFFAPEHVGRGYFHIRPGQVALYSFAALLFYVNSYQFYITEERKKISMYEILKTCPVSLNDLKQFWIKKMIILGGSVAFAHTVLHVLRAYMMYGRIWARTLILPLAFEFLIPCVLVSAFVWSKKK